MFVWTRRQVCFGGGFEVGWSGLRAKRECLYMAREQLEEGRPKEASPSRVQGGEDDSGVVRTKRSATGGRWFAHLGRCCCSGGEQEQHSGGGGGGGGGGGSEPYGNRSNQMENSCRDSFADEGNFHMCTQCCAPCGEATGCRASPSTSLPSKRLTSILRKRARGKREGIGRKGNTEQRGAKTPTERRDEKHN